MADIFTSEDGQNCWLMQVQSVHQIDDCWARNRILQRYYSDKAKETKTAVWVAGFLVSADDMGRWFRLCDFKMPRGGVAISSRLSSWDLPGAWMSMTRFFFDHIRDRCSRSILAEQHPGLFGVDYC